MFKSSSAASFAEKHSMFGLQQPLGYDCEEVEKRVLKLEENLEAAGEVLESKSREIENLKSEIARLEKEIVDSRVQLQQIEATEMDINQSLEILGDFSSSEEGGDDEFSFTDLDNEKINAIKKEKDKRNKTGLKRFSKKGKNPTEDDLKSITGIIIGV